MRRLDHPEDYSKFKFSNRWLNNLKACYRLVRRRYRGEGGDFDESTLPLYQENLKKELEGYALQNVYNCDGFGLQYNLATDGIIGVKCKKVHG